MLHLWLQHKYTHTEVLEKSYTSKCVMLQDEFVLISLLAHKVRQQPVKQSSKQQATGQKQISALVYNTGVYYYNLL